MEPEQCSDLKRDIQSGELSAVNSTDHFPFISRSKLKLLDSPSPNLQAKFTVAKCLFLSKPGCHPCPGSRSFSLSISIQTHSHLSQFKVPLASQFLSNGCFIFLPLLTQTSQKDARYFPFLHCPLSLHILFYNFHVIKSTFYQDHW